MVEKCLAGSGYWVGNIEVWCGFILCFFVLRSRGDIPGQAVSAPGPQLFSMSRCLGKAFGNLAIHKQGNNLSPMLEFIHCCYEGFRLHSHSVGSQQSRVCCWHAGFKAPRAFRPGFCSCIGHVHLSHCLFCATWVKQELDHFKKKLLWLLCCLFFGPQMWSSIGWGNEQLGLLFSHLDCSDCGNQKLALVTCLLCVLVVWLWAWAGDKIKQWREARILGLQVLLFCRSLCWVAVRCEWVCGAHNNFRAESVNYVCRGSSLAALGPCSCCTGSSHHAVSSTEAQVAASPRPPGKSQAGAASGTLLFRA